MLTLPLSRLDELERDPFSISRASIDAALDRAIHESLAPTPWMNGREWIEEHAYHSFETSNRQGKFEMFPFQRDLVEIATDPEWSEIVFMKSARVGYTQLATYLMGYYIQHDPSKVAFILPTKDNVGDYAKDSLNPMLRDIECVSKLQGGVSMDDKLNRYFSNGSVLYLRSAFSSDELRRITAGVLFLDEIDADGWAASGQGDKVDLAKKRAETVSGSRVFLGSSPTVKGGSRIEAAFLLGTQHRRFVPCPICTQRDNPDLWAEAGGEWSVFGELLRSNGVVFSGHQVLEWGDGETHGIHYKTDPENPTYVCRHCQGHIEHNLKGLMDEYGEWRATNYDEDGKPAWKKGVLSFHISTLYSQFEKASWAHAVAVWKDINGDPEKRQTFENTWLGRTFEDWSAAGKMMEPHELQATHCVEYGAEVPAWVKFLTAGVDMQSKDGGRFEVKVLGWGAGQRKAVIGHHILDQHPLADETAWVGLRDLLLRQYRTMDNRRIMVAGAAMDSGSNNGSYTERMYQFAAEHRERSWWAIKGHGTKGRGVRGNRIWPTAISPNGRVYRIDVDIAKDQTHRQLYADIDSAGAIVFPGGAVPAGSVPFDKAYFERLTREKPLPVKGQQGKTYWSTIKDQEPWDCLIYCVAAMYGLLQAYPRKYEPLVASPPRAIPRPNHPGTAAGGGPAAPVPRPSVVQVKPKPPGVAQSPAWLRR